MIVLTGSDGTIRDKSLVENWEYSPHIHHVGGDNYQDFRGGGWGGLYMIICVL